MKNDTANRLVIGDDVPADPRVGSDRVPPGRLMNSPWTCRRFVPASWKVACFGAGKQAGQPRRTLNLVC